MSKLFNAEVNTINYHLKEIFKSEELKEESVIRKIRITANDGKNVQLGQVNVEYGNKLQIYLQNAVLIMIKIQK